MQWKDYFYFTKTERNGIMVLAILIVIVIALPHVMQWLAPPRVYDFSEFDRQVTRYEEMLAEYHKAREVIEAASQTSSFAPRELSLQPSLFDPNTISREEFLEMGIPERISRNVINYREAGGVFRYKEDLKRIYSIDEALYAQLETYIELPARPERTERRNVSRADTGHDPTHEATPSWAELVVDINQADTVQWQQIRGIGPVFSRRITAYRDLLGGFYSTQQLLEVYGMDSARFEQIQPHINLEDTFLLRKIDINRADFATLIRHPYLDRNQVNSILRMRERHGEYSTIEDIKRSELIDDTLFARIAPYLSVSEE